MADIEAAEVAAPLKKPASIEPERGAPRQGVEEEAYPWTIC